MMTQVMLSQPVPSPEVSGAKQWSNSCQEATWNFKKMANDFRKLQMVETNPNPLFWFDEHD